MVVANTGRTVGDMAKYLQMDLAHGIAGAGAILGAGLVVGENMLDVEPGGTFGEKNYLAAGAALGVGALLFVSAGRVSESRGDYLSAASLGAAFAALFWATDFQLTLPEEMDSPVPQSTSKPSQSTETSPVSSPRTQQRESGSWG